MRSDEVKQNAERAPHRSLCRAMGYTKEELDRPLIGVANPRSEIVPGHFHLDQLAEAVKAGIRLAGAYSITALVAAEMIGSHAGLGFLTLNSQEVFQIPSMYAGILLLALLGLALNFVLSRIEKRLTRWRKGLTLNG